MLKQQNAQLLCNVFLKEQGRASYQHIHLFAGEEVLKNPGIVLEISSYLTLKLSVLCRPK